MSLHRRARLTALLAAAAVTFATLVPVLPAAADEIPTPVPTSSVEPVETPTADPTADPTSEPEAAAASTTTLTGAFVSLPDGEVTNDLAPGVHLFNATGVGYLLIQVGDTTVDADERELTVAVPNGIDAGDLAALVDYSVQTAPLTIASSAAARQTAAVVNQTPNTSATHKIYAVLVTPNNGAQDVANQTAAKVATSVAHADSYWSQQSAGTIRFTLAGTTSWYSAAANCTTTSGSTTLWNQAAGIAATQLGYVAGPNTHLVLFFPRGQDCDGAIGYGSIERATNIGGEAWVVGTDAPVEQASLAHELGHNLSLGHASWLECPSANPHTGLYGDDGGCIIHSYGDLTDVMGFGQANLYGGALSAPQAIRAGIWPSSASKLAPKGTHSYTLKPVSGNSGLRSVIVEDSLGVNYFVEFRNYTDEDARSSASCDTDACVAGSRGVRILRLSQESLYKGIPGDDSYVVGRLVGGVNTVDYKVGQTYSNAGISIKVTNMSSTSATISVVRNFKAGVIGTLSTVRGLTWDNSSMRVGDTFGVLLGYKFIADSVSFQWYRSGSKISGATKQYYTLTNADYLKTISVKVTATSKGFSNYNVKGTIGVVDKAVVAGAGTVSVLNTTPLRAVPAGFPWGTTFAYQWYRGASKIAGATSSKYTPIAADAGQQVKVVVTPTSAGNVLPKAESVPEDFGLQLAGGVFAISGTAKVPNTLSAPVLNYQSPDDGPITVTRAFVWYRNGSVIPKATQDTYKLGAADVGATIVVRVTASAPGYVSHTAKTSPTAAVAKGTIAGTLGGPTLAKTGTTATTIKLTPTIPTISVTEPGVTYSFQWYRSKPAGTPEVAIPKATKASYTLTADDYNKLVWLTITVKKPGFTTELLGSARLNYSVTAVNAPVISGTTHVGDTLTVNALTYGPTAPDSAEAYTWYRDGKKILSTLSASYQLTSDDLGKRITVRVTASHAGFLPLVLVSPATAKVTKTLFGGTLDTTVTQTGRVLSASVPTNLVPTATYTYQWYRDGKKIASATQRKYTLTEADYGTNINVRVAATKSGYISATFKPTPAIGLNYSLMTVGKPAITGEVRVGKPLSVTLPDYRVGASSVTPSGLKYRWFVGSKQVATIDGGAETTYTPVPADSGKKITVRITAFYDVGAASLLPAIQVSAATQPIGKKSLAGWDAQLERDSHADRPDPQGERNRDHRGRHEGHVPVVPRRQHDQRRDQEHLQAHLGGCRREHLGASHDEQVRLYDHREVEPAGELLRGAGQPGDHHRRRRRLRRRHRGERRAPGIHGSGRLDHPGRHLRLVPQRRGDRGHPDLAVDLHADRERPRQGHHRQGGRQEGRLAAFDGEARDAGHRPRNHRGDDDGSDGQRGGQCAHAHRRVGRHGDLAERDLGVVPVAARRRADRRGDSRDVHPVAVGQ